MDGATATDWRSNLIPAEDVDGPAPAPQTAAQPQQNDLGYQNGVPHITVRPPGVPVQQSDQPAPANDWKANLIPAEDVDGPTLPPPPQSQQRVSPDRGIIGRAGHMAGVAGAGMLKGAAAINPVGLAGNALSMGANVGAMAGIPLAAGVNYAMGNPTPWRSAVGNAQDAMQGINKYIPNTNSLIDKTGVLPTAENKAEDYVDTMGQFAGGGAMAGQKLLPSLLGGAGSETAGQVAKGTPFEPAARLLGGGAGFAAGEKVAPGGRTQVESPISANNGAPQTFMASDKQMKTGVGNFESGLSDPNAVRTDLQNMQNGGEIVQGIKPTTAEVSTDQGLAQSQNAMRQRTPEPFQAKDAARRTAIAGQFDQAIGQGNPADLSDFLIERQRQADAADQAQEGKMLDQNRRMTQGMQGQNQAAMQKLGRYGEVPEPNASGQSTDTGSVTLNAQKVRQQTSKDQFGVLDSVNNEPGDMVTVRNAAQKVIDESQEYGMRPIGSKAQGVIDSILNPPEGSQDTVKTLRNFRSNISAAQRALGPEDAHDMARLETLKKATDEGLRNTVNGLALRSEDFYNNLQTEAANAQKGTGEDTGTGNAGNAAGRSQVPNGAAATESTEGGKPNGASRDQSVPESSATGFGKQQLDQYNKSIKQYSQNKILDDLDKSGAVNADGQIDTGKFGRWVNKTSNQKRLANNSDFGEELRNAASMQKGLEGHQKEFQDALDAYRAGRVQEQAEVQRSAVGKFLGQNADPVKAVGEIFSSKKADQAKVFKDLVDKVKGDPDALAGLRSAVSKHINDNIAKASMDQNPSGQVTGKLGRPDMLRQFITQNKNALREVYGGGQALNNLEGVASEIRRNQEWESRANIKGQSNTAKNMAQTARNAQKPSMLGWIMKQTLEKGGTWLGASKAGPKGAVFGKEAGSWLHDKLTSGFRQSNLDTVEKIQLKMYDDPVFAREMLQRFGSQNPTNPALHRAMRAALKTAPLTLTTKGQ